MFTCSKKYSDLPFAHRQHNHGGHCRLIHGHNWAFHFTFASKERDANGFVIDFGDLKWLKQYLVDMFDHTLVLNQDDPGLEYLKIVLTKTEDVAGMPNIGPLLTMFPFAAIRIVPNAGAEGLAQYVFEEVDRRLRAITNDRVFLHSLVVSEDEKNSATYAPVSGGCNHV